jgi:hypothetical protein
MKDEQKRSKSWLTQGTKIEVGLARAALRYLNMSLVLFTVFDHTKAQIICLSYSQ